MRGQAGGRADRRALVFDAVAPERDTLALLQRELRTIRQRGYSIDDEEIEEGLRCVGAPVRDHSGRVVASMSIAGPAFRVTRAKAPVLARVVIKIADTFSPELGYRPLRRAPKTA